MTADLTPSLDEQIAAARTDRDALMALLRTEQPALAAQLDTAEAAAEPVKSGVKSVKFEVVRQRNHMDDERICGHRFEVLADLCAYRRVRKHAGETGGHYTVRRADA